MKKLIVILFINILITGDMSGLSLKYKITTGNDTSYETFTITRTANGLEIVSDTETFRLDNGLAQFYWSRNGKDDADEPLKISACRVGDVIKLSGTCKGRSVEKTYRIDSMAWTQAAQFSLSAFARSGIKRTGFWAISIHDLGIFRMEALNLGLEKKSAGGKELDAAHIRIQPEGIGAAFWHGDYWFSKPDFLYVRYEAIEGMPGSPITIKELIE